MMWTTNRGRVVTVAQFVENKYRTLILPVRKPTTRRGYEVVLRQHVLPELGTIQLAEATPERVQSFINCKAGSMAWNTLRNIRTVAGAIFAAAVKYGYQCCPKKVRAVHRNC